MRFALSTNWNNARLDDGSAIVDEALALGFDALELGFRTTPEQLAGFRRRIGEMPVDSVHAYCPVPVGAPSGHPELHQLADPDEDERALARLLLKDTLHCAQDLGAKVVVTHAGYARLDGWFVNYGSDALRQLILGPDGKPAPGNPRHAKFLAKAKARRLRDKAARQRRWRNEYTLADQPPTEPMEVSFATGCFLFIRTHPFYRLGGFDRRFFLYQEDSDLSLSALKFGKIVYHPDMVVTHAWHRDSAHELKQTLLHVWSTVLFFNKWGWKW